MTDKLKKTIQEELEKLPKENREAINSLDWMSIIETIGAQYLFIDEEITNLQTETLLVLIGLETPDLYENNVADNVPISKEKATKISDEVFQKIFTPINDIIIENIKKSDKMKNADAEQNLNFILSGGDYSVFLEQKDNMNNSESETEETVVPVFSITGKNLKKSSV